MTSSAGGKPGYTLLYHPGIPGRGEYIRLAFEASGTPYTDLANEDKSQYKIVQQTCGPESTVDSAGNPPPFAPPALKVQGGKGGKDLVLYQTPNILLYLGQKLGLAGSDEHEMYYVNELALVALDLSNEAHDTHHPVAVMKYYEDQKEEALKKSQDFRETRVPKFLSFLERNLKGNESQGKGKYLVGSKLSYADTTWWQVLDGLHFAFPKEIAARKKDYPLTFGSFYDGLKQEKWLNEYISSDRRLAFSQGLFRHYSELDRQ